MIPAARLAGALTLIALAGCSSVGPSPAEPGSTSTSTTVGTTTSSPLSVAEAVAGFEDCLDRNGFDIEPIPFDATGRPRLDLVLPDIDFSDQGEIEAFSECAAELSSGALDLDMEPALRDLVMANLVRFAECVRNHGVPGFPDPLADFAGVGTPFPLADIPLDDPDLAPATATCLERLEGAG